MAQLLFVLLSCLMAIQSIVASEIMTLVTTNTTDPPFLSEAINLAAGDFAEIIYTSDSSILVKVLLGGKTLYLKSTNTGNSGIEFSPTIPKLVGPAEIYIERQGFASTNEYTGIATFKITRANSPMTTVPSTAVVIPQDEDGQYEVILESSTDMITWTAAQPGTYGGDTVKRFFRTRIVKKAE